jgi:ribosomal protein S18 acetylase RimI-like enzyme
MESSDYLINICEFKHIPQLVELWIEYLVDQGEDPINDYIDFSASKEGFYSILEGYLRKEPEGFMVATVSDEVVGFLIAYRSALSDNYKMKRKVGNVQVVHVKRGFRGRGIASSLLRKAMRYLESGGCSAVLAETGEDNEESLNMLTKLGFKQRGKLVTFIKEL